LNILEWRGEPIARPGIWRGVPAPIYHGQLTVKPSISTSGLKTIFDQSPAHYFEGSYLNPANWQTTIVDGVEVQELIEQPASEALTFGRAAHHLLLGEADFRKHFTIQPATYVNDSGEEKPWNNNAAVCKKWHREQKENHRTVLTMSQIEHIKGMAQTLGRHPLIKAGILGGLIEHSMVYRDPETGVWLKVRPDAIPTGDLDFSDLKSIADISDDGVQKSIGENNYPMQGAMVRMACRELLGLEMTSFTLVFSEKKPPYCCRIHTLTGEDLDIGEMQVRAALQVFARCLQRSTWPGPGGEQTDAQYATMTPWRRKAIERRLKIIEAEMSL
jgi:hypothetical protein